MLTPGPVEGIVVDHCSTTLNDKEAIKIVFEIAGETKPINSFIYVTEKSYGMARQQLKLCGWKVDDWDLGLIDSQPPLLKGNKVSLVVELYNGKTMLKIPTNARLDKSKLSALSAALRDVKKRETEPMPPEAEDVQAPVADHGDPLPF